MCIYFDSHIFPMFLKFYTQNYTSYISKGSYFYACGLNFYYILTAKDAFAGSMYDVADHVI